MKVASFKISNPDSVGVNDFSRTPGSHGGDIAKSVMGPSVCPIAVSGWQLKPNAFFGISSAPGGCAIPGLFRCILFNKIMIRLIWKQINYIHNI